MKTTITILVISVLVVSCSRRSEPGAAQQFRVSAGDIAAPPVITTNRVKTNVVYGVQMKLTATKEAELLRFTREHPDEKIQVMSGDQVLIKFRMSSNDAQRATSLGIMKGCDSPEEAARVAASWDQLRR